jgi:excisionase family DNA binding protein
VSSNERLCDPDLVITGAAHAIERARARGVDAIEPDDLLAGLLLAVSRFGIVDLGALAVDLDALGLRYDLPPPDPLPKPGYTEATIAAFDRAARIARTDGPGPMTPLHLLVALADPSLPTFALLVQRHGLTASHWRRLLAGIEPPAAPAPRGNGSATPAPADPLHGLLTPEQAADLIGVHIQTLRGYIRSGRLPAFRVAGERALRIRRDDLHGLLEHLQSPPPAPVATER